MQQAALRPAPHRQRASYSAPSVHHEPSGRSGTQGHAPELRRRVASSLAALGYAALGQIECEVEQGQIVLVGSVSSYHLKQMAQEAALRVAGLHRVDNRVVVATR